MPGPEPGIHVCMVH